MIDINKEETSAVYNFLNRHLKYFETTPAEYDFWNEHMKLDLLAKLRDKMKRLLREHA